jgi:hypothetical protein
MVCCHVFFNMLYIVIGVVVYWFCGQYVAYPALGSAGPLLKKVQIDDPNGERTQCADLKICYGISIPGLAMTLCLYCHVSPSQLIRS